MSCCLCLSGTEILIPVFDEQGLDTKGVAAAIARFIDLKIQNNCDGSVSICILCWAHLDNFQTFCRQIQEKQKDIRVLIKKDVDEEFVDISDGAKLEKDFPSELEIDAPESCCKIEIEDDILEEKEPSPKCTRRNSKKSSRDLGLIKPKGRKEQEGIKQEPINDRTTHTSRKIGRPGKKDATTYNDEDRLIASHMPLICEECQLEQKTFYELKKHFKKAHSREGYAVCCNKRLYKKGLLVEHIHVHKNPDYFKCSECMRVFADRVCLRNHTLLMHNKGDDLPYTCKTCSKRFAKIYFLKRHALKHATSDEKSFHCEQCNKSYPSSSLLKGHFRNVHGEAGLNVCSHCGTQIRGSAAFKKHQRQHEGISGGGVQCDVCSHWLSDKYVLRQHMERHTDSQTYYCEICGKQAPSRVALKAHYRYHHTNTEPSHKCTVCDKVFRTPRSLREHIAVHTGDSLYTCSYCPKTFKCSSNLHAHRKWQHPVEWARDKEIVVPTVVEEVFSFKSC